MRCWTCAAWCRRRAHYRPSLGPTYLFRDFAREVHAWINVTAGTTTPSQQAAALHHGLGGLAWTIAMRDPSARINFGVVICGRHADGATYR
eukprot:1958022-Pyramimonas_sp.AAC.1